MKKILITSALAMIFGVANAADTAGCIDTAGRTQALSDSVCAGSEKCGSSCRTHEPDRKALFNIGGNSAIETPSKLKVGLEARFDFDYRDIRDAKDEAGFHGRYLNLRLDGNITSELSYHFRQRLNKFSEMKNDVFGATDWIYIDYAPSKHWNVAAGKMVLDVGGYEYDRAPIDVYFATLFWNNFACYQFGVSGRYNFTGGRHSLSFQFANSPYAGKLGDKNFGYSLMWRGNMGCFSTLWSVNAFQYGNGHLCEMISLGNRFDFGNCYLEVDLQNRHSRYSKFWLGDYYAIGKFNVSAGNHFNVFAKGGYQKYRPEFDDRTTVSRPLYGVGMEYFPLKHSHDLRIHAAGDVTYNTESTRIMEVQVGVTWVMNILNVR